MKYHWALKTLAFLLAVVLALLCILCTVGTVYLWNMDAYQTNTPVLDDYPAEYLYPFARNAFLNLYLSTYPDISEELLSAVYDTTFDTVSTELDCVVVIQEGDHPDLYEYRDAPLCVSYTFTLPQLVAYQLGYLKYPEWEEYETYSDLRQDKLNWYGPDGILLPDPPAPSSSDEAYYLLVRDENGSNWRLDHLGSSYVTVSLVLNNNDLYQIQRNSEFALLAFLLQYRYAVAIGAFVSALAVLALVIYLCFAAGKGPGITGAAPRGINRMPMDLLLTISACLCAGLVWFIGYCSYEGKTAFVVTLMLLSASAVLSILLQTLLAAAAQLKLGKRYLLRHTVIARILRWFWKGLTAIFRVCLVVFEKLPLMIQWLLVAMGMFLLLVWGCACAACGWDFPLVLAIIVCILVVIYGCYCFAVLHAGARNVQGGNLRAMISTKYMVGSFRSFGNTLNALTSTVEKATQQLTKSERMKTELVANVSHDLKTPLTSIINYVDLLQKPHTEEEAAAYLEVLARQSNQMKKLIDDLVEMSKANTGNIACNLENMDLVEAIRQAVGEFSDRLSAAGIGCVCRMPEKLLIRADGKLVWRVLSNLLSNTVKYALPGTRLYITVQSVHGMARVTLKNISKEELTATGEELTERFVRGDSSRNTEGSGLGLNIAKSLMELQKGQLEVTLDGDLFKVTLAFPECGE